MVPNRNKNGVKPEDFTPNLVPLAGLEPARSFERGILSPLRLPIPPQRRLKMLNFHKKCRSSQEIINYFRPKGF